MAAHGGSAAVALDGGGGASLTASGEASVYSSEVARLHADKRVIIGEEAGVSPTAAAPTAGQGSTGIALHLPEKRLLLRGGESVDVGAELHMCVFAGEGRLVKGQPPTAAAAAAAATRAQIRGGAGGAGGGAGGVVGGAGVCSHATELQVHTWGHRISAAAVEGMEWSVGKEGPAGAAANGQTLLSLNTSGAELIARESIRLQSADPSKLSSAASLSLGMEGGRGGKSSRLEAAADTLSLASHRATPGGGGLEMNSTGACLYSHKQVLASVGDGSVFLDVSPGRGRLAAGAPAGGGAALGAAVGDTGTTAGRGATGPGGEVWLQAGQEPRPLGLRGKGFSAVKVTAGGVDIASEGVGLFAQEDMVLKAGNEVHLYSGAATRGPHGVGPPWTPNQLSGLSEAFLTNATAGMSAPHKIALLAGRGTLAAQGQIELNASDSRVMLNHTHVALMAGNVPLSDALMAHMPLSGLPAVTSPARLLLASAGDTFLSAKRSVSVGAAGLLRLESDKSTAVRAQGGLFLGTKEYRADSGVNPVPHGHVLLAPRETFAVGIGPSFSEWPHSKDRLLPSLVTISNVSAASFVPREGSSPPLPPTRVNPGPDAHLSILSDGDAAMTILSPDGFTSSLRFGSSSPSTHPAPPRTATAKIYVRNGHQYNETALYVTLGEGAQGPTLGPSKASKLVLTGQGRVGLGKGDELDKWGGQALKGTVHMFGVGGKAGGGVGVLPTLVIQGNTASGLEGNVVQLIGQSATEPNTIVLTARKNGVRVEPFEGSRHWMVMQRGATTPALTAFGAHDNQFMPHSLLLAHSEGGSESEWQSHEGVGRANKANPSVTAAAFSPKGTTGFGTAPTSARVTVGGKLLSEEVHVMASQAWMRDVTPAKAVNPDVTAKLLELQVLNFNWNAQAAERFGVSPDARQTGLSASNAQQVLPELVSLDPAAGAGTASISHSRLLSLLLLSYQQEVGVGLPKLVQQGSEHGARLEQMAADGTAFAASVNATLEGLKTAADGHGARLTRGEEEGRQSNASVTALHTAVSELQLSLAACEDKGGRLEAVEARLEAAGKLLDSQRAALASAEQSILAMQQLLDDQRATLERMEAVLEPIVAQPSYPVTTEEVLYLQAIESLEAQATEAFLLSSSTSSSSSGTPGAPPPPPPTAKALQAHLDSESVRQGILTAAQARLKRWNGHLGVLRKTAAARK